MKQKNRIITLVMLSAALTAVYTGILGGSESGTNKTAAELFPLDQFKRMLGFSEADKRTPKIELDTGAIMEEEYPSRFNLRDEKIISSVKNQGGCGACWAFTAVAVFESLIKRELSQPVDLSEQQMINCIAGNDCDGGHPYNALKYMQESGIVREKDYRYQEMNGNCDLTKPSEFFLSEYYSVAIAGLTQEERVQTIKSIIYGRQLPAVGFEIYGDFYYNYSSGVYIYDDVSARIGSHTVVITGWVDEDSFESGGYWICKNSWGKSWGEDGYFRIAYGEVRIDGWILNYAEWYGINTPPAFTDLIGEISAREGASVEFTVSAEDEDGDELEYSVENLPEGAHFDNTAGRFQWAPDFEQAGIYSVTIKVSDGRAEDSQTVTITIINVKKIRR